MKHIEIYTDGACSGNPGPGGWGAILRFRTGEKVYEKEISGGEAGTTNNRMELTGLLEALPKAFLIPSRMVTVCGGIPL